MSLPPNFQTCTVTAQYIDLLGNPISGTVIFTASPAALLDQDEAMIIVPKTFTATLDGSGAISIVLPATDDPDINPTNWTYAVNENFTGGRKYNIKAPQNTTIDLSLVSPVPSSAGAGIIRGPKGEAGGIQEVNGHTGDIIVINYADVGADEAGAAAAAQAASLQRSNNLNDVASTSTARSNLGLGTAATHPATDFALETDFSTVSTNVTDILAGLDGVVATEVTDWNTATTPGLYSGGSAANAPTSGSTTYSGIVFGRAGDPGITQVVVRLTDTATPEMWQRTFSTSGWKTWTPVFYDTGWINLGLTLDSFTHVTQSPQLQYRRLNGVVYFRGGVMWRNSDPEWPALQQGQLAVVPTGFRPKAGGEGVQYWPCVMMDFDPVTARTPRIFAVTVDNNDGTMTYQAPGTTSAGNWTLDLTGLCYPADN